MSVRVPAAGYGYCILDVSQEGCSSASYEVTKSAIFINGAYQAPLAASDFDAHPMCKAQYGGEVVEVNTGEDHIGDPSHHCALSSIQTLGTIGYYQSATLSEDIPGGSNAFCSTR